MEVREPGTQCEVWAMKWAGGGLLDGGLVNGGLLAGRAGGQDLGAYSPPHAVGLAPPLCVPVCCAPTYLTTCQLL